MAAIAESTDVQSSPNERSSEGCQSDSDSQPGGGQRFTDIQFGSDDDPNDPDYQGPTTLQPGSIRAHARTHITGRERTKQTIRKDGP